MDYLSLLTYTHFISRRKNYCDRWKRCTSSYLFWPILRGV